MSEGLHLICRGGVTRPYAVDPFQRRLAYLMSMSLENLTELVERWNREMRKIIEAMNQVQRAFALLAGPLRELECLGS